jgi:hypothetical protein
METEIVETSNVTKNCRKCESNPRMKHRTICSQCYNDQRKNSYRVKHPRGSPPSGDPVRQSIVYLQDTIRELRVRIDAISERHGKYQKRNDGNKK